MARVIRYVTCVEEGVRRRVPVVKTEENDKLWAPPSMWEGGTAFIIGGGPSLNSQDLSLLHHRHVIGVNDAYSFGNWIDVCTFGDPGWSKVHDKKTVQRSDGSVHPGLRRFRGLIVALNKELLLENRTDIRVMDREPNGFTKKRNKVGWNGNTGVASINLALHLGALKIVLLGFDFKSKGKESNWHDNLRHPNKEVWQPNYNLWKRNLAYCKRNQIKYWPHVEVLNATPDSAIPNNIWPYKDLYQILREEDG